MYPESPRRIRENALPAHGVACAAALANEPAVLPTAASHPGRLRRRRPSRRAAPCPREGRRPGETLATAADADPRPVPNSGTKRYRTAAGRLRPAPRRGTSISGTPTATLPGRPPPSRVSRLHRGDASQKLLPIIHAGGILVKDDAAGQRRGSTITISWPPRSTGGVR
jgi:hypothetical protein